MAQNPKRPENRAVTSAHIGFSTVDFGKEIFWRTFEIYALFYLTDILGVPPELAGLILLMSLAWDAATDPIIGYVIDFRATKGFDYTLYFMAAPLICTAALVLLFMSNEFEGIGWGIAIAAILAFRTAYTFVDVPVNAYTALVARSPRQKSLIWGWRKGFAAVSALTIAFASGIVLADETPAMDGRRIAAFTLIMGVAAILVYAVSWRYAKGLHRKPTAHALLKPHKLLASAFRNRLFLFLLTMLALNAALSGLLAKGLIYTAKYVIADEAWFATALGWLTAGGIAAIPISTYLSLRSSREISLMMMMGLLAVSSVLFYLNVDDGSAFLLMVLFGYGLATGGISLGLWSLTPDILDPDAMNGKNANGGQAFFLGLFSTGVKVGVGASSALAGLSLALVGFVANEPMTPEDADRLQFYFCAGPVIFAAIGVTVLVMRQIRQTNARQK